jgi:hypothetical protein
MLQILAIQRMTRVAVSTLAVEFFIRASLLQ